MSKKSFRDNPALQFMSRTEKDTNIEAREDRRIEVAEVREIKEIGGVTDNFRAATPTVFEAKSKRFNMLIRPSVYESLKKMSENKGTSVNDLINKIVEGYIEDNGK